MKLFQDKFSIYKKAGEPLYKTPKSVQECIELLKIAPDGIFEVANNRYSKSYLFSDVNYNTASGTEQVQIFESYCKFLNAMDVRKAYYDVKKIFKKRGFEHRQGSGYISKERLVQADIADLLDAMYSYNGMGFREVFTRYMRSIIRKIIKKYIRKTGKKNEHKRG